MKKELEDLGFVKASKNHNYELKIHSDTPYYKIHVNYFGIVWLERGNEAVNMFPYNYEKVKQLIKLLS